MYLRPYINDNFTADPLITSADLQINHRQPRTFSAPNLLTLIFAASLLAKAAAKSHYGAYLGYYTPWQPYRPTYHPHSYQNYNPSGHGYHHYEYSTENPLHHHYHQAHAPPVNQQQIVNIHERPLRPHGMGGETFEDVHEQNHQHIITTIQRPIDTLDEEVASSNDNFAVVLPDVNFINNLTEVTSELPKDKVGEIPTDCLEASTEKPTENSAEDAAETNLNYRRVRPDVYTRYPQRRTTYKPIRKYNNDVKYSNRRPTNPKHRRPYITTYPSYFEDYEEFNPTTQRPKHRRRTTTKRNYPKRKPNTDIFHYDEYNYDNSLEATTRINSRGPNRNKRRPIKPNHRRRPAHESTESEYYSNEENDDVYRREDEDSLYSEDVDILPRQGTTTSTTTETTTTETSTQPGSSTTTPTTTSTTGGTTTTSGTTTSASTGTQAPMTSSPSPGNATQGYGYGYGMGHDNVSITYGPPGHHGYPNYDYSNNPTGGGGGYGYGPSQGNENISITYGPPTLQQRLDYVAPLLDAWYSQYSAKNAVVRRIQELLHQNTQQQPQGDNYANYNDNVY